MSENRDQTYIYGNTVRNIPKNAIGNRKPKAAQETPLNSKTASGGSAGALPKRNKPVKRDAPKITKSKRAASSGAKQAQRERMNVISFSIFLIGMVAVAMVFFNYIDIHTKTLDASRVLNEKEIELNDLKSANDAKEDSLNSKVELQSIYEIATTQYGMVHANENQIIVYKKNESEYIKQNEDIPTE